MLVRQVLLPVKPEVFRPPEPVVLLPHEFAVLLLAYPAHSRAMLDVDVHPPFNSVQLDSINKPRGGQAENLRIKIRVLHGSPPWRTLAGQLPTEKPEGPKIIPTISVFLFYGLALWGLSVVVKKMDVSIAYAVWSGVGTATVAMIGICIFGERATVVKICSLLLIIIGVVGLNYTSSGE